MMPTLLQRTVQSLEFVSLVRLTGVKNSGQKQVLKRHKIILRLIHNVLSY